MSARFGMLSALTGMVVGVLACQPAGGWSVYGLDGGDPMLAQPGNRLSPAMTAWVAVPRGSFPRFVRTFSPANPVLAEANAEHFGVLTILPDGCLTVTLLGVAMVAVEILRRWIIRGHRSPAFGLPKFRWGRRGRIR